MKVELSDKEFRALMQMLIFEGTDWETRKTLMKEAAAKAIQELLAQQK